MKVVVLNSNGSFAIDLSISDLITVKLSRNYLNLSTPAKHTHVGFFHIVDNFLAVLY